MENLDPVTAYFILLILPAFFAGGLMFIIVTLVSAFGILVEYFRE